LGWKSGSRGKIHERCCHGLSERSCSQRQIVVAETSVTPCSNYQPVQLSAREGAQRALVPGRRLARHRDERGDLLRGENGAVDLTAACPPAPPNARRRTVVFGG
jgi:hypothetical protein